MGHAHAAGEAEKFINRLEDLLQRKAEYIMDISPVIGVHVGIGALSVSLLTSQEIS